MMSQMDQDSGLSAAQISDMDNIVGGGGQPAPSSDNGALSGPLEKSGLYDIPGLGGLLGRGIVEPLAKGGEMAAEGFASPVMDLLTKGKITGNNRFMNDKDFQNLSKGDGANATWQGATQGLQTGLAATGALELPALIKGILSAPKNIGLLSKKGVWSKMEDAAAKKGGDISWDKIAGTAMKNAENKSVAVQKALKNLIAERTPPNSSMVAENLNVGQPVPLANDLETGSTQILKGIQRPKPTLKELKAQPLKATEPRGNPVYNLSEPTSVSSSSEYGTAPGLEANLPSSDLIDAARSNTAPIRPMGDTETKVSALKALNTRAEVGDMLPSNMFEKLFSKVPSAEQEAIKILRNSLSEHVKLATPGLNKLDNIYRFYSKAKGDVPTWGKRIIGGVVADQILGKKMGGNSEGVVDALGVLLGGAL